MMERKSGKLDTRLSEWPLASTINMDHMVNTKGSIHTKPAYVTGRWGPIVDRLQWGGFRFVRGVIDPTVWGTAKTSPGTVTMTRMVKEMRLLINMPSTQ